MRTCQEITELAEKRAFERLTFMERMELRMHKAICPHCKKFFKDSAKLDSIITKSIQSRKFTFSREEKDKMIDRLKDQ